MNIFMWVICGVLMVLGAAEAIRTVVLWLTGPAADVPLYLVAVPKSGEDCEAALRGAAHRLDRLGAAGCGLICLNARQDPEIIKICTLLRAEYPTLIVTDEANLAAHCTGKEA